MLKYKCSEAHAYISKRRALTSYGKLSSSQQTAGAVDLTLDKSTEKEERVPNFMAQTNLFIGSLAYATTDDTLKAHFEKIGEVASARVITDRDSGRSKGFGFVEFVNEADNQKAIDQLNDKELDGRTISVGLARPKEDRPRRDFGGNSGSSNGNSRGGNNGSFRQRSW